MTKGQVDGLAGTGGIHGQNLKGDLVKIDRTCRASKVQNSVHAVACHQLKKRIGKRFTHVALDQPKIGVLERRVQIFAAAGQVVIYRRNSVATIEQSIAQMRADKASSTGHDHMLFRHTSLSIAHTRSQAVAQVN